MRGPVMLSYIDPLYEYLYKASLITVFLGPGKDCVREKRDMENEMKFLKIGAILAALLIVACSSSDDIDPTPKQSVPVADYTFVHFNPASGNPAELPLPNDILRNPVTGQNSVPSLGSPSVDALVAQFNTISGFSTSAPLVIPFVGGLDQASVNNQNILVVDTADLAAAAAGAQVNPFRQMAFQVRSANGNDTVIGLPVTPLKPGRTHIVIVTNRVLDNKNGFPVEPEATTVFLKRPEPLVDANGNSLVSVLSNAQAQALEPLRLAYSQIWPVAESVTGQGRLFIPFAFAFTTQNLYSTLEELKTKARASAATPTIQLAFETPAAVDAFFQSQGLGGVPHSGIGRFYRGTISVPYYISDPADPLGPVTGSFTRDANGTVQKGTVDVPFIAALPIANVPVPAVMFQHGITRSKEDMLGIANTVCLNGAGVIAIDLVLHGERTFGLDVLNNDTGAPGPDGVADTSGSSFINLQNLLVSRDNIRQSVADLYRVTHMITSGAANFNGDAIPDFAPIGLSFVGQSLGGILGTVFTSTEENVSIANLNVAGARIPYLLQNSPTFGPRIDAGLAASGLGRGSFLYDLFFIVAQTITDDADPFNYATQTFSGNLSGGAPTAVLLQEMIGDPVVPNSATEDLARAMAIPQANNLVTISGLTQVPTPHQGSALFQFNNPNHGCILDPTCPFVVAVQTQTLTFIGSALIQGTPLVIDPLGSNKGVNVIKAEYNPEMLYHQEVGPVQFFPLQ